MRTITSMTVLAAVAAVASATKLPSIAQDWTSVTTSHIVVNQGGQEDGKGDVCCDKFAPQCKVQTGYQAAKQYFDYTNQRVATKSPDNSGVVVLLKDLKQYAVNGSNYCTSYCPIPQRQARGFIEPLGFPNGTVDLGPRTYNGQKTELYMWRDAPLFNITFERNDFYVNIAHFDDASPVFLKDTMTPFGMPIGFQTQSWHSFQSGSPDASQFVVHNKANCPMSQRCAGSQQDDPYGSQDDHSESDLTSLHRYPGVKDSSFISAHMTGKGVEEFDQAPKPVQQDNNLEKVREYYSKFNIPEHQRRMMEAAMRV